LAAFRISVPVPSESLTVRPPAPEIEPENVEVLPAVSIVPPAR